MSKARRFELHRSIDDSGISGVGVVAEGCEFSDGTVVLHWVGAWPTSTVVHLHGIEAVKAVHGHAGHSQIVFLDDE